MLNDLFGFNQKKPPYRKVAPYTIESIEENWVQYTNEDYPKEFIYLRCYGQNGEVWYDRKPRV